MSGAAARSRKHRVDSIRSKINECFGPSRPYLDDPVIHLDNTDEVAGKKRTIGRVQGEGDYAAPVCILVPDNRKNDATAFMLHGAGGGLDVCCGAGSACGPRGPQVQVDQKKPNSWGRMLPSTSSEYERISAFFDGTVAGSELSVTPDAGNGFGAPAVVGFLANILARRRASG